MRIFFLNLFASILIKILLGIWTVVTPTLERENAAPAMKDIILMIIRYAELADNNAQKKPLNSI